MPIVRREHVTINTEIDESGETTINEKNSLIQNNEKIIDWLDYKFEANNDVKIQFDKDDIKKDRVSPHHCRTLLMRKYGARSSRLNDEAILKIVAVNHDKHRERFKEEFRKSLEDVMVDIAAVIGMREGKASLSFIDVPKHVLKNPTYSTICRLTYLMRGVFDSHTNVKLKLEKGFMNRCNFVYSDNFESDPRNHGCFAKILSDVFTQKHRDINTRLQNKHGFKCVQRSIEHKKLTNDSRMLRDNKSYFGIIKNVQYNKKDENENSVGIERLIKTTPEEVNYQPNSLGELNFSLLEGIVIPRGSLFIANKTRFIVLTNRVLFKIGPLAFR